MSTAAKTSLRINRWVWCAYVLSTASTYFCEIYLFVWLPVDAASSSLPPRSSPVLISIIFTCFYTVDTNNIFSLSRALHSNVLIFPGQNYFTITFGRPWARREIIWLLLSEGISGVKRLLFLCKEGKGTLNAWRTPAEWMLFTAERAAALMMSAIKQQRYRRRSGNGLLPPAILQLLVYTNSAESLSVLLSVQESVWHINLWAEDIFHCWLLLRFSLQFRKKDLGLGLRSESRLVWSIKTRSEIKGTIRSYAVW